MRKRVRSGRGTERLTNEFYIRSSGMLLHNMTSIDNASHNHNHDNYKQYSVHFKKASRKYFDNVTIIK